MAIAAPPPLPSSESVSLPLRAKQIAQTQRNFGDRFCGSFSLALEIQNKRRFSVDIQAEELGHL